MKNIKTFTYHILAIVIIISNTSILRAEQNYGLNPNMNNYAKEKKYIEGSFSDVIGTEWYSASIATAFEYGLVSGITSDRYGVSNNVTIAETIVLASRIDSIFYTGRVDMPASDIWYQSYVDYALDAGIINEKYSNYNDPATRSQFAEIMSNALPSYALEEINWIDDNAIPDVKINDSYGKAVYKLYRAGIISGADAEGTFNPNANILRTEVAAIITRMVDVNLRQSKTLMGDY